MSSDHHIGIAPDGREFVACDSAEQLREWLTLSHGRDVGIWLAYPKGPASVRASTYGEYVEELLCFGWVDSTAGSLDDERALLWIAPRRRGSGWSKPNKDRVARLEQAGRMRDGGRAVIKRAKADGSWTVLDASERGDIPTELITALALVPEAEAHFAAFPPSVRKMHAQWIATAKREATRDARILEIVALAADNVRANGWPRIRPTAAQLDRACAAGVGNKPYTVTEEELPGTSRS